MRFIADLHIHSRFSMATSRNLTLPVLAGWAMRKGINVLGTGDFTHPGWRKELAATLAPDDASGLLRLKIPAAPPSPAPAMEPLFCLQTEISCIYKRNGRVRKIHNLIFMPDFAAADKFSAKLASLGNIASDGRPILGLDSRDLFELALDCSPRAALVPAHIWTPWFGVLGSKSGFDALQDCYGDLTSHIVALETGLSSDPPMNRLVSALDNFAMISNSDAHSGANLGREANLFSGQPSYDGIFAALAEASRRKPDPDGACQFLGTLEFYPEEGKYHLDGHRACNLALAPDEARALNNICPVCAKPLTVGVLHRVTDLADRQNQPALHNEPPTRMLIPLPEVVGQIMRLKPGAKSVEQKCAAIVSELGPELDVLCLMPLEQISTFWEPLGLAIERVRDKNLRIAPGYDGVYGKIDIFGD
ncbi:MAG: hypothetical protein HDQ44_01120 [Desulfovibrio sp.]|nr:hypothetical protein [Desulfovibrio sp.]